MKFFGFAEHYMTPRVAYLENFFSLIIMYRLNFIGHFVKISIKRGMRYFITEHALSSTWWSWDITTIKLQP